MIIFGRLKIITFQLNRKANLILNEKIIKYYDELKEEHLYHEIPLINTGYNNHKNNKMNGVSNGKPIVLEDQHISR